MTIATVTREVFLMGGSNTWFDFLDFLATRVVAGLGFTLVDSNNSIIINIYNDPRFNGERRLLSYQHNNNSRGTLFFDIQSIFYPSDTNRIKLVIGDASLFASPYTTAPSALMSPGFAFTKNVTTGDPLIVTTFDHPELKALNISRGYAGENIAAAIIRPTTKPSWWSENVELFSFLNASGSGDITTSYPLLSLNPAGNGVLSTTNLCNLSSSYNSESCFIAANPITGLRSMIGGVHIITNESAGNRGGVIGSTSSDIALVNATGLNINSIIQVQGSTTRYQTISKSDNNPVLAVKVVE